jgi:drug/metabolite transporter (DMT)-like permease
VSIPQQDAPVDLGWKPWAAFAAISFIWGSTWLAHKWALADLTPAGLMTLRLGLAGVLCFAIGRVFREQFPARTQVKHVLFAGVMLTGLANLLTAWTLTKLPSGVGAVLQAPIPVWMALFSMRKDPISKTGWVAVLLGLAGVSWISWPNAIDHFDVTACIVCIATAAMWSWASLYQRKHVSTGGLYTNAGMQMLQGALLGSLLLLSGQPASVHGSISTACWLSVAYLVLFGSCIAFASYLYLTKVWHPARAGSFSYLNPVVAVVIGAIFGGEKITTSIIVGLSVILLAVAVLQIATIRTARQGRERLPSAEI